MWTFCTEQLWQCDHKGYSEVFLSPPFHLIFQCSPRLFAQAPSRMTASEKHTAVSQHNFQSRELKSTINDKNKRIIFHLVDKLLALAMNNFIKKIFFSLAWKCLYGPNQRHVRGEPTLPQFTLLIKADLKVRIKYVWVQLSAGSSWSVKMMTAKSSWKRWIILTDFWSYCQDHRVDVKVYPAFFF